MTRCLTSTTAMPAVHQTQAVTVSGDVQRGIKTTSTDHSCIKPSSYPTDMVGIVHKHLLLLSTVSILYCILLVLGRTWFDRFLCCLVTEFGACHLVYVIFTFAKEVMFSLMFVCMYVTSRILQKTLIRYHKIWWIGGIWAQEETVRL